jgi:hypothetical protein
VQTYGANSIAEIFDPNCIFLIDRKAVDENLENLRKARSEIYVTKPAASPLLKAHVFDRFNPTHDRDKPPLSRKFEAGLEWSFTSAFPAFNFACIQMEKVKGPKHIRLAGIDMQDDSHFYDAGTGARFLHRGEIRYHFFDAKRYLAEWQPGLKIWNANPASYIDSFDTIDFGAFLDGSMP